MGARLSRWWALTGIAFVGLWVTAFALLAGGSESPGDAEIVAYYGDETNRARDVTVFFLVVAASLVFLGFVTVLCGRLVRVEGRPGPMTTLAFGGGIAATTLWLVAGVFWMAVSYTANETTAFRVDPNTERLVSEVAYLFFVTGMYAAIPVVLGASLDGLRTRALPRWLGWLGLPVGVSLLGALGVFPFFLLLVWVALVSIALIVCVRSAAVPNLVAQSHKVGESAPSGS